MTLKSPAASDCSPPPSSKLFLSSLTTLGCGSSLGSGSQTQTRQLRCFVLNPKNMPLGGVTIRATGPSHWEPCGKGHSPGAWCLRDRELGLSHCSQAWLLFEVLWKAGGQGCLPQSSTAVEHPPGLACQASGWSWRHLKLRRRKLQALDVLENRSVLCFAVTG